MRSVLITIIFTALLACGYKPDIRQGNVLDDEKLTSLKVGMTQQQVVQLLGSPMLKDSFHRNRWDYIEAFTPGRDPIERRLLTLYFENGRVVKIDRSQLEKQHLND